MRSCYVTTVHSMEANGTLRDGQVLYAGNDRSVAQAVGQVMSGHDPYRPRGLRRVYRVTEWNDGLQRRVYTLRDGSVWES